MDQTRPSVEIALLTKNDFDQILSNLERFWGERDVRCVHHPMFLYEFGDTAYVIREGNIVVAYLWGFVSSSTHVGYVHLIGVRDSHRRKHLASHLYRHFIDEVKRRACSEIKAITTPDNLTSIAFHRSIGMQLQGDAGESGIPVV